MADRYNRSLVEVAIPRRITKLFHYRIPEELKGRVAVGVAVRVPFGRMEVTGYVVGFPHRSDVEQLKEILAVEGDAPFFDHTLLELFLWVSHYYFSPLGQVLKTALPSMSQSGSVTKRSFKWTKVESAHAPVTHPSEIPIPSEEQARAIEAVTGMIQGGGFHPILLQGVTGSGKTEVYLHAIKATLTLGKGALFLVPEIALTAQLIERLRARLTEPVEVLHSALSPRERWQAWEGIRSGRIRVALGVRSAVFAPFPRLGLIVVDEEQDPSYKQGEGLRYHARDVALMRAKHSGATVILGSATPSLETYQNSQSGRYGYLLLTRRVDHRPLPTVRIVDLRSERLEGDRLLSPSLLTAMRDRFKVGEQVLLFLNRRGFLPSLLCRDCGYTLHCPNCSVSLTLYKKGTLLCHYCDFEIIAPNRCPECQGIRWGGVSGGTERLEEEVRSYFPETRMLRMDRDTTRRKNAHGVILRSMAERRCDILIGTQMIAKGHDLPGITLVGIVLADIGLSLPDFRASERLFHVVTQVAGRCGRGSQPGEVIVQTFNPEETTLLLAARHDWAGFYQQELLQRKGVVYPPFCRLILLVLQGNRERAVKEEAQRLGGLARELQTRGKKGRQDVLEILGPAPAPIGRLRGKHRYQLLIKGRDVGGLHTFLKRLLHERDGMKTYHSVELIVDVDPQAFL